MNFKFCEQKHGTFAEKIGKQQDQDCHTVADRERKSRAENAQISPKHEKRNRENARHISQSQTTHCPNGSTFRAEQIGKDKRGAHERRGKQKTDCVGFRKGKKDSVPSAKQTEQRISEDETHARKNQREDQRGEKRGGRDRGRFLMLPRPKRTGKQASRTRSEHETDRLNGGNDRKSDPDGATGGGSESCHKKSVRHCRNGRQDRREDRGQRMANHQSDGGGGRHLSEFVFRMRHSPFSRFSLVVLLVSRKESGNIKKS